MVPYAYKDKVQKELERMVKEGIIIEETAPTDWCCSMLVRRKSNGKF